MKKIAKIMRALFISISIFLIGTNSVSAKTNAGEILISKTATKEDFIYGRSANVELKISANSFTNVDKTDVVLVIDRSSSMNGKKINDTVLASIDLLNTLITRTTKEKIRVGIVSYNKNIYEKYSSNSLTNDINELMKLVNNTSTEYGTNIHAGLLKAESLLSNSDNNTNKVIILLTDGEPYQYIGSDLVTLCDRNSKGKNCKSTPSNAAIDLSAKLKEKNISIYTVGFQIENDNTAKKVLTDISSDPDTSYSYLASDYTSLKNTFKNMVKNFTNVATNGKVVDIIPANFKLKVDTLPNNVTVLNNVDGTTSLTWNVGDISSLENKSLAYTILANENNYGNMYTNVNATLTATSTDNNPIYGSSKPISIDFDKPAVPIPNITVNDDYTINNIFNVKQGEILKIDEAKGILSNDLLKYKNLDNNAIVTNKIILVTDSETNGNLDDIVINSLTGEFTYKSNSKIIGNVTYKYYIETTILVDDVEKIVKSNTSTIKLNVIKNPTMYTVHYYEEGTKNSISNDKIVTTVNVYEEINELAIDIDGYNKINPTSAKLVLKNEDNIITFYYSKKNNLSYTINYLEKSTNKVLKSSRVMNNVTFKDKIDTSKLIIDITGYIFNNVDKKTLEIGTKENEVNIYYVKSNGTVKSLYLDKDNKNIVDSIIVEGKIDTEYEIKPLELTKYKLLKVDGVEKGKYIDGEILVTYIYEKVPDTQIFKESISNIAPITSLTLLTLLLIIRKRIFN